MIVQELSEVLLRYGHLALLQHTLDKELLIVFACLVWDLQLVFKVYLDVYWAEHVAFMCVVKGTDALEELTHHTSLIRITKALKAIQDLRHRKHRLHSHWCRYVLHFQVA